MGTPSRLASAVTPLKASKIASTSGADMPGLYGKRILQSSEVYAVSTYGTRIQSIKWRMRKWLEQRIEELRPHGKSKAGLAKAMNVRNATIHELISGVRKKIKVSEIPAMAKYLEWPATHILELEGMKSSEEVEVAVAGYVGAGGSVEYVDSYAKGGGVDNSEPPPEEFRHGVALRVRGTSQLPFYRDGDVVFYTRDPPITPDRLINRECVVRLAEPDGRTLLKTIRPGTKPRRFTLASFNEDDMPNVKIEWAAPVQWIKRGR